MKLNNMFAAALVISITFITSAYLMTTDLLTNSSCPSGTDLIDNDVCVTSNGNYFAAHKEQLGIQHRLAVSFMVIIIGLLAATAIYFS